MAFQDGCTGDTSSLTFSHTFPSLPQCTSAGLLSITHTREFVPVLVFSLAILEWSILRSQHSHCLFKRPASIQVITLAERPSPSTCSYGHSDHSYHPVSCSEQHMSFLSLFPICYLVGCLYLPLESAGKSKDLACLTHHSSPLGSRTTAGSLHVLRKWPLLILWPPSAFSSLPFSFCPRTHW